MAELHRLNPDVGLDVSKLPLDGLDQFKKDQQEVRQVCKFVTETIVPKFVSDIGSSVMSPPFDGSQLTTLMHKRGINMRYLGLLYNLADKEANTMLLDSFKNLVVREAVSRSIKHILSSYMKQLPVELIPYLISHYLNCLLLQGSEEICSSLEFEEAEEQQEWLRLYPEVDFDGLNQITAQSILSEVVKETKTRFRLDISDKCYWLNTDPANVIPLFREISLKLGLQWEAKTYDFSLNKPVVVNPTNGTSKQKNNKNIIIKQPASNRRLLSPENLVNIVPVVKPSTFRSQIADDALEAGKMSIFRNEMTIGKDLLFESLSIFEQVYGPIHADVARAYSQVASALCEMNEYDLACELGHKAVIISERCLGTDSAETLYVCLNVALFEHSNGNTVGALHISKFALERLRYITNLAHPELIVTMSNVAAMLQTIKAYDSSVKWYNSAIDLAMTVYGPESVNVGTLYFQFSQLQVLMKEYKAAVKTMQKAHRIFDNQFGPNDANTKECKQWVDSLVTAAVNVAKFEKAAAAAAAIPGGGLPRTRQVNGSTSSSASSASSANRATNPEPSRTITGDPTISEKSIDEIVSYINGPSKGNGKKSKKSSRK